MFNFFTFLNNLPATTTWKYRAFCSSGTAEIPGTGSCINLWVSWKLKFDDRVKMWNFWCFLRNKDTDIYFNNSSWQSCHVCIDLKSWIPFTFLSMIQTQIFIYIMALWSISLLQFSVPWENFSQIQKTARKHTDQLIYFNLF